MTDKTLPDEFEDINEVAGDEWESETTPSERVRHVIAHTYSPASAATVAGDARTSPKTARKHLNALADEGFVVTTMGKHGGANYRRSPESLVVEQAADILEHVSTDELVTRIAEMRDRLNDYQAKYGVDSPEEVTIEQTNQTLSETDSGQSDIDAATLQDWQTTRRNLAFANAALSIANAERFVDGDSRTADDSVPV
jgi:DNA-binding IscR family transcriptional regulator